MYRYREAQRCLLEFINRNPSVEFGKEVWEQLQYIEEQLTQFEAGEDQAKQRAWVVCRGR